MPRPTEVELERGVPLFLDQLADTLRLALDENPAIAVTAAAHATGLLRDGFTIAQVVHNYGGICQTITELAGEKLVAIATSEFRTLNACLDDAIAGAVTEYSRVCEYDMLRSRTVGIGGSTGEVLRRSLAGLRNLIDRELAEVSLGVGIHHRESVVLANSSKTSRPPQPWKRTRAVFSFPLYRFQAR